MSRALEKRLERIEAEDTGDASDLAAQIVAARKTFGPTHTREELKALAADGGLTGRLALGWMRIGFYLPDDAERASVPQIDPEAALAGTMGYLYDKPLQFVLFAYPWGADPALRVVRLPDPWALEFDSEFGPDVWACELLDELARQVRMRAFDGQHAVEAIRMGVSSGHGIGKGALTSWLANWVMSTRPNARGVVTASTAPQLESKTWAQIATWTRRCITAEWWDVSTGRGSMKMVHRDYPESWRCDAQTAREETSESFAGLHAADSSPFYLVDESSGVPDAIYKVMQGGLTDGEPFMLALGNPTKNTGWFSEIFGPMRHRWTTWQIDSRGVQVTNKLEIANWIEDYGITSDFVKVKVLGVFPSASSLQFIDRETVLEAMQREIPEQRGEPAVVGVDVARFGDDASVIRTRVGRDARGHKPIRMRGADTMQVAAKVGEHINFLRQLGYRVHTFIDGGGVGGGVIDRLRQLGYDVVEVLFGGKPDDVRKYANKSAEMWGRARDWLKIGAIDSDERLAADLTGREYGFTVTDQILLEKKSDMKSRGLDSPDDADALVLTFAHPVAMELWDDAPRPNAMPQPEYDPYSPASLALGHSPHASIR